MTDRPFAGLRVAAVMTTGERGGGEYATVDLLDLFARLGATATLATNLPDLAAGAAVDVRPVDLGPKLGRASAARRAARAPALALRLRRAVAALAPLDLLLLPYKKEQLLGSLLPRRGRPAIAWLEWGPIPRPMRAGAGAVLLRAAGRGAGAVLAVSESTAASLREAGLPPAKVHVVPPFVDPDAVRFDAAARARLRAEWGAADSTLVIGCVSRLHPLKPVHAVVEAAARVGGDVLLVVAGDGAERAALEERARRLGLRARFEATPRGRVAALLSACDVQVFAAAPTEGAPRSIVLGQLTERPVVALGAAGSELVVPGTGAVVERIEPAALAAVLAGYREEERRRAEGEAGRAHAAGRYGLRPVQLALSTSLENLLPRR